MNVMVHARSCSFQRTIFGWLRWSLQWWPPCHCCAILTTSHPCRTYIGPPLEFILYSNTTNKSSFLSLPLPTRAPPCSTHVPCCRSIILCTHQLLRSWVLVTTRTFEDLSQHSVRNDKRLSMDLVDNRCHCWSHRHHTATIQHLGSFPFILWSLCLVWYIFCSYSTVQGIPACILYFPSSNRLILRLLYLRWISFGVPNSQYSAFSQLFGILWSMILFIICSILLLYAFWVSSLYVHVSLCINTQAVVCIFPVQIST